MLNIHFTHFFKKKKKPEGKGVIHQLPLYQPLLHCPAGVEQCMIHVSPFGQELETYFYKSIFKNIL